MLQTYAVQIMRLCLWLLLLSAVFLPLERLFALRPREILRPGVWTDLAYYFLSSLLPGLVLSLPLAAVAWVAHHTMPDRVLATVTAAPLLVRAAASLLLGELGFYWGHRWSHEIPLLWRFHAIHHSAEHMDYLVNTRAHPVDLLFTRLCGLVPLYVLGLAAPVRGSAGVLPLLLVLVGTAWGFFIHANVRWRFGFIESLVATPAFHHWHHTNDSADLYNKNYASMLPWIDQLFGTLHLPAAQHPGCYGIDQPTPAALLNQLIDPFRPARTLGSPLSASVERREESLGCSAGEIVAPEVIHPPVAVTTEGDQVTI